MNPGHERPYAGGVLCTGSLVAFLGGSVCAAAVGL